MSVFSILLIYGFSEKCTVMPSKNAVSFSMFHYVGHHPQLIDNYFSQWEYHILANQHQLSSRTSFSAVPDSVQHSRNKSLAFI